jgi:hypothetical protein
MISSRAHETCTSVKRRRQSRLQLDCGLNATRERPPPFDCSRRGRAGAAGSQLSAAAGASSQRVTHGVTTDPLRTAKAIDDGVCAKPWRGSQMFRPDVRSLAGHCDQALGRMRREVSPLSESREPNYHAVSGVCGELLCPRGCGRADFAPQDGVRGCDSAQWLTHALARTQQLGGVDITPYSCSSSVSVTRIYFVVKVVLRHTSELASCYRSQVLSRSAAATEGCARTEDCAGTDGYAVTDGYADCVATSRFGVSAVSRGSGTTTRTNGAARAKHVAKTRYGPGMAKAAPAISPSSSLSARTMPRSSRPPATRMASCSSGCASCPSERLQPEDAQLPGVHAAPQRGCRDGHGADVY